MIFCKAKGIRIPDFIENTAFRSVSHRQCREFPGTCPDSPGPDRKQRIHLLSVHPGGASALRVPSGNPFLGGHPEIAGVVRHHAQDHPVRQAVRLGIGLEYAPVKPIQSLTGPDPDTAFPVLQDALDPVVRQAIRFIE